MDYKMNMDKRKLSIVVLTMNRKYQVTEAIMSCMACNLPKDTQIVVVDNGSTDGTEKEVKKTLSNYSGPVLYHRIEQNIGCAPGRQVGYELANAEYVYFMDDDAIIPNEMKSSFFISSIEYLDANPMAASLTTRIKDIVLKYDRPPDIARNGESLGDKPLMLMYLGGSHFLRKKAFPLPLYMKIKYGYEEFAPSVSIYDRGLCNVYSSELFIIHKPKINKWIESSDESVHIARLNCYLPYAIKRYLYPSLIQPILLTLYLLRIIKHFGFSISDFRYCIQNSKMMYKQFCRDGIYGKIRFKTIIKLVTAFGVSVL